MLNNIFSVTKINITDDLNDKYWNGKWNKIVRYYFYMIKGLQLFNELRYVIITTGLIYAFLKLSNFVLFPVIFFSFIPPLIFFGWLSVHKIDKIIEFLQVRYATHYSHYNIEIQEKQEKYLRDLVELQTEILKQICKWYFC